MKKIILLLVILATVQYGKTQIVQSSCTAPDSVLQQFTDDADRLALRRIFTTGSSFADSVGIPIPCTDTLLNALLAVYNAYLLPARDTVIEIFPIHTFADIPLRKFEIEADSNLLWMQNIRKGVIPTGDAYVDSLINKYLLFVKAYYDFGRISCHTVIFIAGTNLNINALTDIWQTVPGVYRSIPDSSFSMNGDPSDILYSIYNDHIELAYSLVWNTRHALGGHHHTWKFDIYFDCTVEFIGSYGDPTSTLGICNEIQVPVTISPNPFGDKIRISGLPVPYLYSIRNTLGKLELSGISGNGELNNLSQLEKGVYILTISLPKSRVNFKIIKE
ncbi:MAG: T9SS type A sorting domain-containing protein [Bacteroidota bacterium]